MTDQAQSRVLLVDDDPSVLRLLRRLIEREDLICDAAETGHQALTMLEEAAYDVLVLDKNLPDKDGIAVARDVRMMHPAMPILLITGYASEQSAREAAALRIADYILKPIEIEEFRQQLRELLRLSDGLPHPEQPRIEALDEARDTLTRSDRAEVLLVLADVRLRDTISDVLTICGCNVAALRSTVEAALVSGGSCDVLIANLDHLRTSDEWLPPEVRDALLATIAVVDSAAQASKSTASDGGISGVFSPPYLKPKLAFEFERVMLQIADERRRRRRQR
jgi:CheY-like chemotaxis protein